MERVGHLARSFEEAERWERAQDRSLTVDERFRVLAELKRRAYPGDPIDVRASREARLLRPVR